MRGTMARITIDDCAASQAPARLIRRIDRLMRSVVEARFSTSDLSFSQWIALKLVLDGMVSTPGELARELGHNTGAVTRLIDALENRGLLRRERLATDRRAIDLVTTAEGREQVNKLADIVVDTWNEVLADIDEMEFDVFMRALRKLQTAAQRKASSLEEFEEA